MTIGYFIKEARLKKGMTQEELAAKTDISVRTIQRIEKDEVDPRSYTLHTIASVLEIAYEELINLSNNDADEENSEECKIWLPLLHLSGLFILLLPPIIIWIWKKEKIPAIRKHAVDVVNFQFSMTIYLFSSVFLTLFIIGIPLLILLGLFSTAIIIINTIKVINNQPYKYPFTIKIIKF
jgi:uncharacterized Tic20 family protein